MLPSGQGLLGGQTRSQIRRNRLPLDSTSGQPIPMTSRAGEAIPMGGDLLEFVTGIRRPSPTDAGLTYSNLRRQYDLASPKNTRQQYIENLVNNYFQNNR